MTRTLRAAFCFLALLPLAAEPARHSSGIDPDRYLADVRHLSSQALGGRGTGTAGLDKAADYIAAEFKRLGLRPYERSSYFQLFPVTLKARLGQYNRMTIRMGGRTEVLKQQQDFIPLNFSASDQAAAPVVFAGYGITAPECGYDDYAGIDARGKIVLLLKHEPQEFDARSVFEGRVYTEHSQLASKAANAKSHGARAVVMVNDSAAHPGSDDSMEKFTALVAPGGAGIPFVQVRVDHIERWFTAAGKDFKTVQESLDRRLIPQSFEFPGDLSVEMRTDVQRHLREVRNVIGFLPGQTNEYIVIGAHYDHLGLGEQYSLAPGKAGTAHPGADDNASGTAGVLALARWAVSQGPFRRGIVFTAFAGEELGLLGSGHFVRNSPLPIDRAVAMINMDMIGRIRDNKIYVGGGTSGSGFSELLESVRKRYPFNVEPAEIGGYGSSDHTTFTTREIPSLFFFSGLHGDYHRPTDTWEKINANGAAKLLEFISDVCYELAEAEPRPVFVKAVPEVAVPAEGAQ